MYFSDSAYDILDDYCTAPTLPLELQKTKTDVASDVYDDPREWSAPEPVTRLHQTIPCAQLFGMGTYENLESRKSGNRISDVTDSGNYSNRSSDVSLSMQSVTGATLTGSTESRMQRKTPDSQFEDYEVSYYTHTHRPLN